MDCTVVSISRALAAGGEDIARSVAQKMEFRFIDDEIVEGAAEKAGCSPVTIANVERSPSLIDRILKHIGSTPIEAGHGAYVPVVLDASESYETLIAEVIHETARAGKVVILAHGASIALKDMPGVFRVLVTGSPEVRTARYQQLTGMDERECRKAVEKSDRARRDFLQRIYDVQHELPTHYDLVVNTDRIPAAAAADLIVSAAGS
jgi:Cytidylate kinase-like family